MSGDDDKDKKGFSGLSDLASDVSGADDVFSPEPSSPPPKLSQPARPRPTAVNEIDRKDSGSPHPIETVGGGKSARASRRKWILGIVAVILVIWLANNSGQSTKNTSYNSLSPAARSEDNRSTRSDLSREIETGKTRAKQIETQIKGIDDRLEDYERRMMSYQASGMTDDYNMLVPSYNSLVSERNDLYEEYRRLIDEVNSKVTRCNSGYR